MDYFIKHTNAQPAFDQLLIAKLKPCLSTDINSRVFSLGQLGTNDECVFGRVLSFEPEINKNITLKINLEAGERFLEMSLTGAGEASLVTNEGKIESKLTCYTMQGEDLQGEYWAANFVVPIEVLKNALKLTTFGIGDALWGNFLREGTDISKSFEPIGEFKII